MWYCHASSGDVGRGAGPRPKRCKVVHFERSEGVETISCSEYIILSSRFSTVEHGRFLGVLYLTTSIEKPQIGQL